MKKFGIALAALCMLFALMAAACAATLPTVAFSAKSGSINGGFDYELTVTVKKALDADLPVEIAPRRCKRPLVLLSRPVRRDV